MALAFAIVGVVCIFYGIVIISGAPGSWFVVFWFVLGAVLLGCACAVQTGWWSNHSAAFKRAVLAVVGVLIVAFVASQALILKDFNAKGEPDLDCIVVLGAQVRNDGPSVALKQRLDTAYDYLVANPRTRCIVSGGQGPNEPVPEAHAMADNLVSRGIDPERIIVEDRSTSTEQNIAFSKELLDPAAERVGIVTNSFHMHRGLGIARKAGFAHVVGIAAPSNPLHLPHNMVRESFCMAKDALSGNL